MVNLLPTIVSLRKWLNKYECVLFPIAPVTNLGDVIPIVIWCHRKWCITETILPKYYFSGRSSEMMALNTALMASGQNYVRKVGPAQFDNELI